MVEGQWHLLEGRWLDATFKSEQQHHESQRIDIAVDLQMEEFATLRLVGESGVRHEVCCCFLLR